MEVAAEGVGVFRADVGLDTAQGQVHDGEAAGGRVALIQLLPQPPPPNAKVGGKGVRGSHWLGGEHGKYPEI